jgi:dTDP-4-amino-4,6-dideoxygalactose transaminase/acetyltransferase-like isoleucine patch superfamily enzyme
VEKPLALEVRQAEALAERAEASGLVLMVGHLLQYHPAFQALEAIVAEGALGRLQYVYSNRLNFGRIRREENILWSFAPHDISMMLRLARCEPDDVWATGSSFLHRDIADVTTTHLSFPNGIEGHVFVSWLHPFKEQKLVVIGDRGMAVFDDGQEWDRKLLHFPHEVEWHDGVPSAAKANAIAVPVAATEPLIRECQHFLTCIATGATPRTDGREALGVLRVLDAAERSMRSTSGARHDASRRSAPEDVFVHETAVVDQPSHIGVGTRIWHFSHVMAGSHIGRDCVLGQNVSVGPDVTIGDRCKIQNNVSVYKGVTLEDGVFCGPSAVFTNVLIPRAEVDRHEEFLPTLVERGASIGANATIVCGTTVGAYSVIGAGAVVTRDVLPHSLVVGVPARRIGWVSHEGERLGPDLVCPRSGRRYRETVGGTLEELDEARPATETPDMAADTTEDETAVPVRFVDLTAQRQRLDGAIERAIGRVVDHQQFILGPEVRQFEERLAASCGASHAVSCANGTDALLLPLLAWGVGPGQAIFVPAFTFAATAEVVALTGASPVFVDVDEDRALLDPSSLEDAVAAAEAEGLRPVGVIPVDLFGHPADYHAIERVAARHGLWVLADAAQSFGATLDGVAVGRFGHAAATSFFPSKPLGCYGDGGAVLTDDADLAGAMRSLRQHGQGAHKYDTVRIGLNSRLDTLQAAVLLQKLDVLPDEIEARQRVAECYAKGLGDVVRVPNTRADVQSAWAQYTIRVEERDAVAARLKSDEIPTAVYYPRALHEQPAYQHCLRPRGGLPVSETLAREVLSLPMHPYLSDAAQERVIRALRRAVAG